MSASHEMVAANVARIERLVKLHHVGEVILTTNKRTIIWCPTKTTAAALTQDIRFEGYHVDMRKGLNSNAYYVQAYY